MHVFTCGVARSSVCPVLARRMFNNVGSVAFSTYNKDLLTNLKDLFIEPTQGNTQFKHTEKRNKEKLSLKNACVRKSKGVTLLRGVMNKIEGNKQTNKKESRNQFDNIEAGQTIRVVLYLYNINKISSPDFYLKHIVLLKYGED